MTIAWVKRSDAKLYQEKIDCGNVFRTAYLELATSTCNHEEGGWCRVGRLFCSISFSHLQRPLIIQMFLALSGDSHTITLHGNKLLQHPNDSPGFPQKQPLAKIIIGIITWSIMHWSHNQLCKTTWKLNTVLFYCIHLYSARLKLTC